MSDKKKGEFIYRMLGHFLMGYCREFGSDNMRKMIRFFADNDQFWNAATIGEKMEEDMGFLIPPWKRGAHDFLE